MYKFQLLHQTNKKPANSQQVSLFGFLAALESLTHEEEPWKKARRGVRTIDYSNEVISIGSIGDYFTKIAEKYNLNSESDVLWYISHMLRKEEDLETV